MTGLRYPITENMDPAKLRYETNFIAPRRPGTDTRRIANRTIMVETLGLKAYISNYNIHPGAIVAEIYSPMEPLIYNGDSVAEAFALIRTVLNDLIAMEMARRFAEAT